MTGLCEGVSDGEASGRESNELIVKVEVNSYQQLNIQTNMPEGGNEKKEARGCEGN